MTPLFVIATLLTLLSGQILIPSTGNAYEFAAGVSAVEEGDDRIRPGYNIYTSLGGFYFGRAFYYGKKLGPVTETTVMVSANRKFGLFRSSKVEAGFGMTVLQERTSVIYSEEADLESNIDESELNGGLFVGIYWSPLNDRSRFLTIAWESGIFPAGVVGGIFLATGRKQFGSIMAGIRL